MMANTKLIYLHGFNSSPASFKARVLQSVMQDKGLDEFLVVPEIPPIPVDAISMLQNLVDEASASYTPVFAGSSLGGFYATWLAERYGGKAVLINPAVRPHEILEKHLGENVNYYTAEHWVFSKEHIQQFRELDVDCVTQPERYLVMLQTGDETLDYRQAEQKYEKCNLVIERGGDHAFTGFDQHIDQLLEFCEISA